MADPVSATTIGRWYEDTIEPGIRDQVRLFRDNGFNTTSSCEHERYVELLLTHDGTLMRLDYLLFNAGYRDYAIEALVQRNDGHLFTSAVVKFGASVIRSTGVADPQTPA